MGGIIGRMNRLQAQLLHIRVGPGAAVLPSEVTRIHLQFAKTWQNGHYGPRKFWQTALRRLKYWNPAVPMIVNRVDDTSVPATLSIYLRQKSASSASAKPVQITSAIQPSSSFVGRSPAAEPTAEEHVVKIDMQGLHSDEILAAFMAKTGAVQIQPTESEQEELKKVEERAKRSEADRIMTKNKLDEKRREDALIAQAKSEAAEIRQQSAA